MKNVVFLVKNGIGWGHIRRALVLAEALQRDTGLRPILISQAHALDLYLTTTVHVVNFPLLHRVPSAVTEDRYLEILNELMVQLDPAVVVEDTYPDARYGALPALRDVLRILVMRRLDGLSFDQLRDRGAFSRYTNILIAQSRDDFDREGHSGDSVAAVESSERVRFVGNIHYIPTAEAAEAARRRYTQPGEQLVVVNGGAGGDQMPDGYGDRLFSGCAEVARRLAHEGQRVRFVLVTGPYYAGTPPVDTDNVIVRRFESHLPELLATADVAVIKPGNNALSETLAGRARLILVPDVSFMEGLDEHSARVADQYGGEVVKPDVHDLDRAIRNALGCLPREQHTVLGDDATRVVTEAVRDLADGPAPRIHQKELALLLWDSHAVRHTVPPTDRTWLTMPRLSTESLEHVGNGVAFLDGELPHDLTVATVVSAGVRVLINPGEQLSPALDRWLRLFPTIPSMLVINATVIRPRSVNIVGAARRLTRKFDQQGRVAAVVDLRSLSPDQAGDFTEKLLRWLTAQPVDLIGIDRLTTFHGDRLLGVER